MRFILRSLFLFVVLVGNLCAFTLPERPEHYVNDYANMFSPQVINQVDKLLQGFEKSTSNQVVVVTVPSLNNQPLEKYSIKLAEKWKIGTREHNNGVILLFIKQDRKMRIEVGYGLEVVLPDAIAFQIIHQEITPAFREGNFDQGLVQGVNAIIAATRNEYHSSQNTNATNTEDSSFQLIIAFLVIGFIILHVMGIFRTLLFKLFGKSSRVHTPMWDFFSNFGGRGNGGGFSGGGGGSFGGGGSSGGW